MKKNRFFNRIKIGTTWGVLLSFSFCYPLISYGVAATNPSPPNAGSAENLFQDLTAIQLPEEIGRIEDIYRGSNRKLVVLIQDAHSIPAAQRSIEKIIQYFHSVYQVNLAAVEGVSTKFDPQIFKSFPDQKLLREVLEEYYQRGELTGSAAASIFSAGEMAFYGIEDWEIYERGVSYFLRALEKELELRETLSVKRKALEKEKETVYSKELLAVDRLLQKFEDNQVPMFDVLAKLTRDQPLPKDSEISLLLKQWQKEGNEKVSVKNEVEKLADKLNQELRLRPLTEPVRKDLELLNQKKQEFSTSQLDLGAFALAVKEIASRNQIPVEMSDGIRKEAFGHKRLREIQGTPLFKQFENYAAMVTVGLVKTSEEKSLEDQSRRLSLLKRLHQLELGPEDWEKIQKLRRVKENRIILPDQIFTQNEFEILMGKMQSHLNFYETSVQRDAVFVRNFLHLMEKEFSNAALLILGGFHAERVSEQLKDQGISYLSVMPAIPEVPEQSRYREHMQGKVSWSGYFRIENGKVNLHGAFVRAVRDRVLDVTSDMRQVTSQDGLNSSPVTRHLSPILKSWRDKLIRDLSDQDRLTEAESYTRFLDEVLIPEESGGFQSGPDLTPGQMAVLMAMMTSAPEAFAVLGSDAANPANLVGLRSELRTRNELLSAWFVKPIRYWLPMGMLIGSGWLSEMQAAPNGPMTEVKISEGRSIMVPGVLDKVQQERARRAHLDFLAKQDAKKESVRKTKGRAEAKKALSTGKLFSKINISTNVITRKIQTPEMQTEKNAAAVIPQDEKPTQIVEENSNPGDWTGGTKLIITEYAPPQDISSAPAADDGKGIDPELISDPEIKRLGEVYELFGDGVDRYGSKLPGLSKMSKQTAVILMMAKYENSKEKVGEAIGKDLTAMQFGAVYSESGGRAKKQKRGPALGRIMIEPAPAFDTIGYALGSGDPARREVLLGGLSKYKKEIVLAIYEHKKAGGKAEGVMSLIKELMAGDDMELRMVNLYIDWRITARRLFIPSHEDPEQMADVYILVWGPGQFFKWRVVASMARANGMLILMDSNPAELVKTERFLNEYFRFLRQLEDVFSNLQSAKNKIRFEKDWKSARQFQSSAEAAMSVLEKNERRGAHKRFPFHEVLVPQAQKTLDNFRLSIKLGELYKEPKPNIDKVRLKGEIANRSRSELRATLSRLRGRELSVGIVLPEKLESDPEMKRKLEMLEAVLQSGGGRVKEFFFDGELPVGLRDSLKSQIPYVRPFDKFLGTESISGQKAVPLSVMSAGIEAAHPFYWPIDIEITDDLGPLERDLLYTLVTVAALHAADLILMNPALVTQPEHLRSELRERLNWDSGFDAAIRFHRNGNGFTFTSGIIRLIQSARSQEAASQSA